MSDLIFINKKEYYSDGGSYGQMGDIQLSPGTTVKDFINFMGKKAEENKQEGILKINSGARFITIRHNEAGLLDNIPDKYLNAIITKAQFDHCNETLNYFVDVKSEPEHQTKNKPNINLIFQNYHKHTYYSNPKVSDSATSYEEYCKRAVELGHGIISSVEHGWQGRYIECHQLAEKYGLKFVFGTEAYWVKDRHSVDENGHKDGANCHIVLIAMNENGRQAINDILSQAAEEGMESYYRQTRIDLPLILSLPADDVVVTSACFLKGNRVLTNNGYVNIEDIKCGDKVVNRYGQLEDVNFPTAIMYNGTGYSISTNAFSTEIKCTADHKYLVINRGEIKKGKTPYWCKAEDIYKAQSLSNQMHKFLLYPLNKSFTNDYVISKSEFDGAYKSIINHWCVKQKLPDNITITPELMRFFGVFIGNGHISVFHKNDRVGISFNSKEFEACYNDFVHPVEQQLGIKFNIIRRENCNKVEISTSSIDVVNLFYWLFGNCKAESKHIPNRLLHISYEFDCELLYGLCISDGSFQKTSGRDYVNESYRMTYCTTSEKLKEDFRSLCCDLGLYSTICSKKAHTDKKGVSHKSSYYISIISKNLGKIKRGDSVSHSTVVSTIKNLYENTYRSPRATFDGIEYLLLKITSMDEIVINEEVYCLNNNTHSFVCEFATVHNCLAFHKYEDTEAIIKQLHDHFGDNFYLEVQYHNTDPQKAINKKILNLHKKYGIKLMMGCDSHYIDEKGALDRDEFIKSKGMEYPDEEGWYMDYPDGNTAYKRFVDQCVLSHNEIMEAMNNTNRFLEVEEYDCPIFNHDIKMPTLYPNLSQEERDAKLEELIWQKWDEYKVEVPEDRWEEYEEQIRYELDIVKTTFHSDYFLLDYAITQLGKEKGGQLTLTGRGCFVGESLVLTDKGYKCIKDITTEDKVVCKTGEFTEVKDTFKYDIDEELVQVKYLGSCNKVNPVVCTSDHKFLVYDIEEEKEEWKPAKNLIPNKDYLCFPKIKNNNKSQDFIDLNQYNVFGFEYDDKYIYEKYESIGKPYKYSPSDVARHLGCGKSVIENYANGKREHFIARNGATDKDVLRYTGFNSAEEYRAYIAHKKLKRINRYIPNDYIMGEFIGMMYGDGFTNVSKFEAGLAINNKSQKNIINRGIFEQIAKRVGMDFYKHTANNGKALSQFYMRSKVFTQYIYEELFISKKGKDKEFNCKFLYESNEIIKGIAEGLFITDGCLGKDNRLSFDNTSLSLIGIYKILHSMCGDYVTGTDVRPEHIDSRGYHSKTSYKVRRLKKGVKETKNYWLLPVKDIVHLPQTQTTVYDISVPYTNSFVLDNCIVHNSGVSFFLNKLLGFTSVDRISAKVKMYPERFMSPTRILETHSLADIDMNVARQEPFWEAQEELLGFEHSKQMVTFQQLKPAAAWKMYAKAQNVDFDTANEISKQIARYLKDYAKAKEQADDDEEIDIDILDYIDEQYKDIYLKSTDYLGVISAISSHPCASLVYEGNIRKEIGYIFVKSQSTDGMLCCCMDGKWAEKYGFLKNDWLKVNVVEVIYKIFERIGMQPFSSTELIKKCEEDLKPWKLYKQQCTKGLNQVEQPSSSVKVGAYAPTNISELTAFVAAVRPGFKSMYDIFESREHFDYNIPTFDKLLQTEEMPNSFVLYQEQAMLTLNYAGIPMSECYAVIKAISKKRVDEITKNKPVFIEGFTNKIQEDEGLSKDKAESIANRVWKIIEDSSAYSFNSAHAYSVGLDSLYEAWLKTYYPLEFYETYLNILVTKNKDRYNRFKEEAEHYFNINFPPFKFRQDNRSISIDKEHNAINNALSSIKGYSNQIADALYRCGKECKDFILVLRFLNHCSIKSAKIIPLIKIGYFSEFGNENALLKFMNYWDMLKQGCARQLSKDKADDLLNSLLPFYATDKNKDGSEAKSWKLIPTQMYDFLLDIFKECQKEEEPTYQERMAWQNEILGYIELTTNKPEDTKRILILDVLPLIGKYSPNPWCYKIETRSIGTGRTASLNVDAKTWDAYGELKPYDIIECGKVGKNKKGYWYIYNYIKEN